MMYTLSRRDALIRIAAILALPGVQVEASSSESDLDEELLLIVNQVGEKAIAILGADNARVSKMIEDIRHARSLDALTEKIEAAVVEDFDSDDMFWIDGWFLSPTEAALYAALFSLNASSQ